MEDGSRTTPTSSVSFATGHFRPKAIFQSFVGELYAHLVIDRQHAFTHAAQNSVEAIRFMA
jgi:hypothetical protein